VISTDAILSADGFAAKPGRKVATIVAIGGTADACG
jgi:hypothetical protein